MRKFLKWSIAAFVAIASLSVIYRAGQVTALDALWHQTHGGLSVNEVNAQLIGPNGFNALMQNPAFLFGTAPQKPIFTSPTNIYDKQSYLISTGSISATGANTFIACEAGAANRVRVRRICLQPGAQTTGAANVWSIVRESAVSSAGTVTVPPALDPADPPYSGICRVNNVTAGTNTAFLSGTINVPPPAAASSLPFCMNFDDGLAKSFTVSAGIANGWALNFTGGTGGAGQSGWAVFTEEGY